MWAEIIDGAVTATRGRLPSSLRRADTGQWVCPPDGSWSVEQAAACGWHPVTETAAPTVAANETATVSLAVVDGLPVRTWTVRPKTADELAAETAVKVHGDLRGRMRQAITDNSAYLAIAAPTNVQNLAQIRRLTRQMNALIRATVGGDLLTDSTDV
jgi:hypothetical protein